MDNSAPSVAVAIARALAARENCDRSGNTEWHARHTERIGHLVRECLPSGSGIDSGTSIDLSRSTPDTLVLTTAFHHMEESGGYHGWTEHVIVVKASLLYGLDLRVSGRDRNGIKDYLAEVYLSALQAPAPPA